MYLTDLSYRTFLKRVLITISLSVLSGCGLGSISGGLSSVLPGSGNPSSSQTGAVSQEQLLAAAQAGETSPLASGMEISPGCPRFLPATRDNFLTIYETGRAGDSLAVMHRGEITKTARECILQPGLVTVKFGFAGRILLGPKGKPGIISYPIVVSVTDEKRTRITGLKLTVNAPVSIEKPIGYFSAVDSVTFKIPEGTRPGDYEVSVAFDKGLSGSG